MAWGLNGVNARDEIADHPSLSFPDGDWYLDAWIRIETQRDDPKR